MVKKVDPILVLKKLKREIDKQINKSYDKHLKNLYKRRAIIDDKFSKQKAKELLNRTFVYINNTYGGRKKSDMWNVYLKVIDIVDDHIVTLTVEKEPEGNIIIQTQHDHHNSLWGYSPCDAEVFERHYAELMDELDELADLKEIDII